MFDSYNSDNLTAFNFSDLYEGKVLSVNENNQCLVYIYKLFISSDSDSREINGINPINPGLIENGNSNLSTINSVNGIYCDPIYQNNIKRKMQIGDDVLVFFFNGDPQRPYYIDGYLETELKNIEKDQLYKSNDISIEIFNDDNPRITFKIKDNTVTFDQNSILGTGIVIGGTGNGNTSAGSITTVVSSDPNILAISQKYAILKEFSIIKNTKSKIEELSVIYSINDDYNIYLDKFNNLSNYLDPLLSNMNENSTIDIKTHNQYFLDYYFAFNKLMTEILKQKGSGLGNGSGNWTTNEGGLNYTTVENIESTIRDMIYTVDSTINSTFLKEMVADGIITVREKQTLAEEIIKINNEYNILKVFAPLHYSFDNYVKVDYDDYCTMYDKLKEYIYPILADSKTDTEVNPEEFLGFFNNYFSARVELYDEIYKYSSVLLMNELEKTIKNLSDNEISNADASSYLVTSSIPKNEYESIVDLAGIYNVSHRAYTLAINSLDLFRNKVDSYKGAGKLSENVINNLKDNINAYVKERNSILSKIIALSNSYIQNLIEGSNFTGGSNLLINSAFKYDTKKWEFKNNSPFILTTVEENEIFEYHLSTATADIRGTLTQEFFKSSRGEKLVLSFWAKVYDAVELQINILDSNGNEVMRDYNLSMKPSEDNSFVKYIVPIDITEKIEKSLSKRPQLIFRNKNYSLLNITHIKLEFGTNPSDWSPAAEDKLFDEENIKQYIGEVSSSITQTIDSIELQVNSFTSQIEQIVKENEGIKTTIEEFRKQQADFLLTLEGITGSIEDVYSRVENTEEMVKNLDIDKINTTLEKYEKKFSDFQLTIDGFSTRVEQMEGSIETVKKFSDQILAKYETVENFMGTIAEWGATVDGLGGKMTKLEGEVKNAVDLVNKVSETNSTLQQDILTMKGSLSGIENSITSLNTDISTIRDDINGQNTEISNIKEQYAGIVTNLSSITQRVSNNEETLKQHTKTIEGLATNESVQEISKQIGQLEITNQNITSTVTNLNQKINIIEKLSSTSLINDFSNSGIMDGWNPNSAPYVDETGSTVEPDLYDKLVLQESLLKGHEGYIDTLTIASVTTDLFKLDPNETYKVSFYTKTDKNVSADVKYTVEALFFNENKERVGVYLNTDTNITVTNILLTEKSKTEVDWIYHYGYFCTKKANTGNELYLLKGNMDNAIKLADGIVYCQLKFTVENLIKNGKTYKKVYFASPRVNLIDSMTVEQNAKLQQALIDIQPDKITQLIKEAKIITTPDGAITINEAYNQTVSTTTAINTTLNQYTSKTDTLSNNYKTLEQKVTQQNTTIEGISSTVGSLQEQIGQIQTDGQSISIVGENIFREDAQGNITPSTIVLTALKSPKLTIDKWLIDDVEVTKGLNADKTELIITRAMISGKDQIVIKCYDTTAAVYDVFTVYRLKEAVDGVDSITVILSNEFIGISTDSNGNNGNYSRAITTIKIYEGATEGTGWNINVAPETPSSITATLEGNKYTITNLAVDSMYVDFIVSKEGFSTYYKRLFITKVKDGAQGLQGIQGEQGVPGPSGTDGKTTYFHVKYSMIPNPTRTDQIQEDPAPYIGTYVDYIEDDSNDPSKYTWSKFQGTDGIPGINGEDGKTSYLHIKYSNDGGITFTTNNGEDVGDYIGQYVDFIEKDSDDPSKYKWKKIKGEDGYVGKDAYTILLTNENQGIATNSNFYPLLDTVYSTDVLVMKGSTAETNFKIENISSANGITVSKNGNTINFAVSKSTKITASEGYFNINIVIDGNTITKKFTWTRVSNGSDGKDGTGVSIKGSLNSQSELPSKGNPGDAYLINGELWIWDGTKFKNAGNIRGPQGIQGEQGIQGPAGKDGRSSYFHIKYSPVPNPTPEQMTELADKYIGTYVDYIEEDSNDPSKYIWQQIKGIDGIPGINGENGETSYLHIKYSDDGGATFTGNNGENVGDYIGQYVDFIEKDSDDPKKYKWVKIKGEDGIQGPTGKDGKTSYFHIKYSDVENPTSSNQIFETPGNYIGTYVDFIEKDSNDPKKYTWSKFVGEDGIPGTNGENGETSYLHIKYSNDGGFTFTSNNGEDVGKWMGQYVDFNPKDSNDVNVYKWSKIRGEDGIQGPAGADGRSSYFHVKYSIYEKPVSSSQMQETPAKYIGTYVDYIEADSNDPNKYKWVQFQGTDGLPGENGENGETSYLHIKYSNDGGKTLTSNNGEDVGDYIGQYVDFIEQDSTDVTKYIWKKIKGEDGKDGKDGTGVNIKGSLNSESELPAKGNSGDAYLINGNLYVWDELNSRFVNVGSIRGPQGLQGIQGEKGEQGIQGPTGPSGKSSYFHIKYSNIANPTTSSQMQETPAKYIGTYVDYIEKDSDDPKKYNWQQIQGVDGIPGINGEDGKTSYLHIKYSDDGGTTFTANSGETVGEYIGQYVDYIEKDSNDPKKYKWAKIKGEDGIQGPAGKDGRSSYFHVKYSNKEKPTISSDMTETPSKYIGTYVDYIEKDSDDPSKYTWTQFKGTDGIPGTNGENGQTSYLHIKYSNDGGFTFTSNGGETPGDYIGQYVDFEEKDSNDINKYIWTKIKGDDAKLVDIVSSSQIFKSTDGGINFSPNTITLTPIFQNVAYSSWKYSTNGGASWNIVKSGSNGLTIDSSSKVLTINKNCNLFTISITTITFRIETDNPKVYDTMTIAKLYDVTDIQIGGRNYLRGTKNDIIIKGTNSVSQVVQLCGLIDDNALYGKDCIISFDWSVTGTKNGTFKIMTGSNYSTDITPIINVSSDSSKRYSARFKLTKIENKSFSILQVVCANLSCTLTISKVKVELGNKATDWTPAPEDLEDVVLDLKKEVTANSSYITQNKDRIANSVQQSTFNSTITDINSNINKINTGLNKWLEEIFTVGNTVVGYDINDIIGLTSNSKELLDNLSQATSVNINNIVKYTTCVYLQSSKTLQVQVSLNNKGIIYINSIKVKDANNSNPDTISFTFVPGWNTIEILTRGNNSTGFTLNKKLSTEDGISIMNCYAVNKDYTRMTKAETQLTPDSIINKVSGTFVIKKDFDNYKNDVNDKLTDTENNALVAKYNQLKIDIAGEKSAYDNSYTVIYSNSSLTDSQKSALKKIDDEYTAAYNSLVTKLDSSLADGNLTNEEINSIKELNETYNNKKALLEKSLQTAQNQIITNAIGSSKAELENQIDGKIETWSQNTDPSTAWKTTEDKTKHTGDLWYNTNTKETKRWSGTTWVKLEDADAKNAEALAKSKRRVFTSTPTTPYDIGDLWITSLSTNGSIKICKTARATGNYNAGDWVESLKYTDDTLANKLKNDLNNLSIGGRNLIKNSAFTNGASGWLNSNTRWTLDNSVKFNGHSSAKISYTGLTQDSWYGPITYNNLIDKTIYKGVTYTVSCWYYVKDKTIVDQQLSLEIKGKKANATSDSGIAGAAVLPKDMTNEKWTKISATFTPNETYNDCCVRVHLNRNGTVWVTDFKLEKGNKATDWSPAPEDTETYVDNLVADLQEQIDGKIETWSQNTDPSTAWKTTEDKTKHTGDLWYNTNTKETKRWSGTTWVKLEDADAKNAEELAKSKKRVFTGTPTTPYDVGDLWITSLTSNGVVKICKTARATGNYNAADWVESLKYTDNTLANKIQNDLNNLSIGGRNLLLNSTGNLGNTKYWSNNAILETSKKFDGYNSLKITRTNFATGNGRHQCSQVIDLSRLTLRPNDYITLSGWIYVDSSIALTGDTNEISFRNYTDAKDTSKFEELCLYKYNNVAKNTWTKFTITSKATKQSLASGALLISLSGNGLIYVSKLKLERGNRATDWTAAPEDTETYVDNLVNDLQEQVDGKIETWSQNTDPSTAWKTTEDKAKHTGDLWYNTSSKETKRWSGTAWVKLEDADAKNAEALAKSKKRVFTGTPTTPYDVGDLWITSLTSKGTIKICKTARASGAYNAGDWVESLKYTDDTLANQLKNDLNNLSIGGRNYILNGKGDKKAGFFKNFNKVENGYGEHTLTSQKTHGNVNIAPGFILGCRDYEVGKQVTISYDFMYTAWNFPAGSDRKEFWMGQRYTSSSNTSASGQWQGVTSHNLPVVGENGCTLNKWIHITKTITIPKQADSTVENEAGIRFYNSNANVSASITFRIKNVKLEYGNKATDWTPAPEDTETYVDNLIADLQEQVDGKIETWSQNTDPSTAWKTTEDKTKHTGDLWYNTSSKETKRWSGTTWVKLEDIDAKNAEALAKSKRRVFTGTPTTPYDVGDLWITSLTSNGTIKICKTTRATGNYNAGDWVESLKYTDNTLANKVQNDLKNLSIGGRNLFLKSNIDQYGLGNWISNGDEVIVKVEGTFIDGTKTIKITGSNGIQYNSFIKLKRNTTYVYSMMMKSSGSLVVNSSNPLHIWLNTTETGGQHLEKVISTSGNLEANKWTKVWVVFETPNTQDVYYMKPFVYGIGTNIVYISKVQIEEGTKPTDWTPAPEDTETYVDNLVADLQEQIDGKIETWSQNTDPSTAWKTTEDKNKHIGDLWYNTSSKETKRWSGTTWVKLEDIDAKNAEALAKSKKRVFTGTPTTPYDVGDLWITSLSSNGAVKVCKTARASGNYNAADWIESLKYTDDTKANAANSAASAAANAAANAQKTANEAKNSAITANNSIADITSDSKLTPAEKQQLDRQMQDIISEKTTYVSQATTYGVNSSSYSTAYTTLYNYCYGSGGILTDLTNTTSITPSTMKTNFTNYFNARNTLLASIANATKSYSNNVANNINIGGRNLVKNSAFVNENTSGWLNLNTSWTLDTSLKLNGHPTAKISQTGLTEDHWYGAITRSNLVDSTIYKGVTYTISCWYYVEDKTTIDNGLTLEAKGYKGDAKSESGIPNAGISVFSAQMTNKKWTKISATFTPAEDYKNCCVRAHLKRNGTVWVTDFKLEKGNKATDWSPAPEDTEVSIDQVYAQISSTASNVIQNCEAYTKTEINRITSYVADTYTTQSEFGSYQKQVSSDLIQTSNSLTASFNQTINAQMGDYYDFKDTVTTYFEFSSNGLIIGKSTSPFKTKLTNDKLAFTQNDKEVAYLSNNKLYIENAEVLNTLTLGHFQFIPRDNGNLSLKWVN